MLFSFVVEHICSMCSVWIIPDDEYYLIVVCFLWPTTPLHNRPAYRLPWPKVIRFLNMQIWFFSSSLADRFELPITSCSPPKMSPNNTRARVIWWFHLHEFPTTSSTGSSGGYCKPSVVSFTCNPGNRSYTCPNGIAFDLTLSYTARCARAADGLRTQFSQTGSPSCCSPAQNQWMRAFALPVQMTCRPCFGAFALARLASVRHSPANNNTHTPHNFAIELIINCTELVPLGWEDFHAKMRSIHREVSEQENKKSNRHGWTNDEPALKCCTMLRSMQAIDTKKSV